MGLMNALAQMRAYQRGVVHTTLNPKGPGAVRIHLVPPRWRPWAKRPYVVMLNGYYVLPLGYSWAILLENFILEVDKHDGEPMSEPQMEHIVRDAVAKTHHTYRGTPVELLLGDLERILDDLFQVAAGRPPQGVAGTLSLREYAPNMRAPHRMDLLVSAMTSESGAWNCNLRCRHCYAAGQAASGARELSTAQWQTIIDRCRRAGIPQLTFTGGEPTRRGDLVELVAHARWFVTRLNTNGLLLTPELCARLAAASLDSVQITLYSHDAAVHNALVGADGWAGSVRGLRNALAAGLDVSVNTPLCRDNAAYLETLAFLRGEGVRYVSCSGLIETGAAASTADSRLDRAALRELVAGAAAWCAAHGMELAFTSPGQIDEPSLREMGLSVPICGACLSNMAVAPDGTVVPCQSWLNAEGALGNLLQTSWQHIWNGASCRALREMDEETALDCPLRARRSEAGEVTV